MNLPVRHRFYLKIGLGLDGAQLIFLSPIRLLGTRTAVESRTISVGCRSNVIGACCRFTPQFLISLIAGFRLSERTTCKLLDLERGSYRYAPRPNRNTALRSELLALARQKPRYGYRRLHALLVRKGYEPNVKRVYRLCVEEDLSIRRKRRRHLVRDRALGPRLTQPNQEWAMDFIVDGQASGRMVRILSVVDAYTHKCLALEADTSLGSGRVARVLEQVIAERGRPDNVRSDNGPEFTSRRMLGWADDWKIGLVHIQPGRPMQKGHVESFHGRLRDECLNTSWFRTLNDVRCTLDSWREEYNCERPHSSLDYRTPREFKLVFEVSGAMDPLTSTTTTSCITEKTAVMNG
jgi:putative transposase